MIANRLGKFGEFAKQYEKARRPYPPEVFRLLKSLLKTKDPLILDLGCGTGISTRQLVKLGQVTGVDPDPLMLAAARRHSKSGVKKYIRARADLLPFRDETFDVVTTFSSLHWFDDKKSIREIRRVLKTGGLLFVGSHMGSKGWRYRDAIIKTIGRKIADFKSVAFHPRKLLTDSGFKKVTARFWKRSEYYSLSNAVEYVQSVSIWKTVPKAMRSKALKGVEEYFQKILNARHKIERKVTVRVVFGIK